MLYLAFAFVLVLTLAAILFIDSIFDVMREPEMRSLVYQIGFMFALIFFIVLLGIMFVAILHGGFEMGTDLNAAAFGYTTTFSAIKHRAERGQFPQGIDIMLEYHPDPENKNRIQDSVFMEVDHADLPDSSDRIWVYDHGKRIHIKIDGEPPSHAI